MKHWPLALLGLADLVEGINEIGHAAYRVGLRRVHHAGVPVISVGNIAFGGTGKTPLVAALCPRPARRRRPPGNPHPWLRAEGEAAGACAGR